jgi:sec-independent protein translocase protein TatA
MNDVGGEELGIVVLIAILLFGPSQLPKLARGLSQAMREFRKAQRETEGQGAAEQPPGSSETPPATPPEKKLEP